MLEVKRSVGMSQSVESYVLGNASLRYKFLVVIRDVRITPRLAVTVAEY